MTYPFVVDGTAEVAPLPWCHRARHQFTVFVVDVGERAAVTVLQDALHDRRELNVVAAYLFEEMIEFKWMIGVDIVDHCHGVPLDMILVEQLDAAHDAVERRLVACPLPIGIMHLLGTVNGDPDEKIVLAQEAGPFVGDKRAIGLNAVADVAAPPVVLLQFEGLSVERQGAQHGFATMPNEEDVFAGLCLYILPDKCFQRFIGHVLALGVTVEACLFQVVAVAATQVAGCSCRFGHDI